MRALFSKKALGYFLIALSFVLMALLFMQEEKKVLSVQSNSWSQDQIGDCAVVLTGGSGRVREGFDLLEQGRIQKLIISGVNPSSSLYQIFPQLPFYSKVNEADVILEKRSGTTYGNAVQSLPLVEALRCRNVLVVTTNLHMYRASRTFKGTYPADISIRPHAVVSGRESPSFHELFVEVVKSLFYSIWAY